MPVRRQSFARFSKWWTVMRFPGETASDRHEQRDDHRDARVDRAATKYGAKIVACQPGTRAIAKVPGDDAVHREHERRGKRGEVEIAARVVAPLLVGPAPPQRTDRVQLLAPPVAMSRTAAMSGINP